MSRAERRNQKPRTNLQVSKFLDQCQFEMVGGLWIDENNNHHIVGLTTTERGNIVPAFPSMEDVYIKDVYQLGLKW